MGKCFNCGKEINLKDGEINCPACGEAPYQCWHCKANITGETKECSVCNFFVCPMCGACGKDCKIPELLKEVKELNDRQKVEHIYDSIKTPDRKNCPNGVPISYGHGKLKNMALRLKGLCVKNERDAAAFGDRFQSIHDYYIGKTWVISQEKEDGEYGIEFREVSNLSICMGVAKKEKIAVKNSEGKIIRKYEQFERIEGQPCQYATWDNLVSKYCYKCKSTFSLTINGCPNCTYKSGKQKGQPVNLKERKSKVHFCQLNRLDYKKEENDEEEQDC